MKINIKQEIEVINKYVKGKILDLGCGEGRLYPLLSKKGNYYSVDIDSKMILKAKRRFLDGSFEIMDASYLNFRDEFLDVVFCGFNVIDEIKDKDLLEVFRVLKRGGLFIFSYHNILNLLCLKYYLMGYSVKREGRKIRVNSRTFGKIKSTLQNFQFIKKYGGLFALYPYCIFKKPYPKNFPIKSGEK